MKTKALRKKLTLKKETVSDLNGSQMKNVYGHGVVDPLPETNTCSITCNPTRLNYNCACPN